jgi:class 3 adenylate cyclase
MRCPSCDSENHEPTKFCIECGAAFKRSCPKCGFDNLPQAKFCGDCGVTLATDRVQSLAIPHPIGPNLGAAEAQNEISTVAEGERKTVTALFADIKGSTELMADLDPEEARAIIDPALKAMIDGVRRYDGYVVQSTGDGIFALFGAPVAHEDHPQRAIYAALRLQEQ